MRAGEHWVGHPNPFAHNPPDQLSTSVHSALPPDNKITTTTINIQSSIFMKLLLFLSLFFLSFSQAFSQAMSLEEALKGWVKGYTYDVTSGLKNKKGELTTPGKLGCSGFAAIVFHRMKHGEAEWLNKFNFQIQQKYGDEAAKLMGFTLTGSKSAADWQAAPPAKGLYFFNVRKEAAGHVGFIEIDGKAWNQHHYSGLSSINGYASGSFFNWLSQSQYKGHVIELYKVTF
ncbi:MAG TPA: hypothetical protein DCP71_10170 [Verrucomicrobiales bacterium]|nr:hypothetical protein [Verrucomicrobiales bacterium]